MPNLLTRLAYATLKAGAGLPDRPRLRRFAEQAYLRDLLLRLRVNCVVDVGANRGWFARHLRMLGFEGTILSIEPIPEDFQVIVEASAGDPRWQARNLALGATEGQRDFTVLRTAEGETVLSSFLAPTALAAAEDRRIQVDVRRLDSLLDELSDSLPPDPRVFLKVDTQGFDVEVVRGAEGWLDRIAGLQSEISVTPLYAGMPHYTDALAYYESLGFALMNLLIVNRTVCGSVLEYDCLMARTDLLDRLDR